MRAAKLVLAGLLWRTRALVCSPGRAVRAYAAPLRARRGGLVLAARAQPALPGETKAAPRLIDAVDALGGRVTAGDVAGSVAGASSIEAARRELVALAARFAEGGAEVNLEVTPDGEIVRFSRVAGRWGKESTFGRSFGVVFDFGDASALSAPLIGTSAPSARDERTSRPREHAHDSFSYEQNENLCVRARSRAKRAARLRSFRSLSREILFVFLSTRRESQTTSVQLFEFGGGAARRLAAVDSAERVRRAFYFSRVSAPRRSRDAESDLQLGPRA